jgi:hypothetical protein
MRSLDKLFFAASDWQAKPSVFSLRKQQSPTCFFHYSQVKPHQVLYQTLMLRA